MRPQRSKTVGTLFPVPQLMRTGHTKAAFVWTATAGAAFTLFIIGVVVAVSVSVAEGAVFVVLASVALLTFSVGSTMHARRAVDRWNAAADEQNRRAHADAVARGIAAEREQG